MVCWLGGVSAKPPAAPLTWNVRKKSISLDSVLNMFPSKMVVLSVSLYEDAVECKPLYKDFVARSRHLRHGWVIASHRIPWAVITYPCLRCLILTTKSLYKGLDSAASLKKAGKTMRNLTAFWVKNMFKLHSNSHGVLGFIYFNKGQFRNWWFSLRRQGIRDHGTDFVWDTWVLVFHEEEMTEMQTYFLYFPKWIQHAKLLTV